jgi:hypothetical protein
MNEKKKIVVHYHIYKAAGSTIIDGLKHQFGPDNVMEVDKHPEYAKVRAYNIAFFEELAETHPSIFAYTAHRVIPNIHWSKTVDVYPITFVRHPLLRAMSVYRFERLREDDWPRKEIARKFDLAGWMNWCFESRQGIECRNVQTQLFSMADVGQFTVRLQSGVYKGDMPALYERLDSMPTVGVVEMFDASLAIMNRLGTRYFPDFHIKNAQVNSTKVVDDWRAEVGDIEKSLPKDVLDRFYEQNADDLALFERYRARLEEQQQRLL